jgi:hypothetical protein
MIGLPAPAALVVTFVLAALAALAAAAGAATIVVDVGGTGDYTAIQPALNAAAEGDIVLVLPGTYTGAENHNLFGSGYTKNVVLRSRDGALATIIDCQSTGGTRGINFIGSGQDSTCVVDGFTIRNGRLTQSGVGGAGVRCEMSTSPKLVNLIIKDNNNVAGYGGGLYCNNNASPIVRNVLFEDNHAQAGGGIYCNMASQPRLRDVTFFQNHAVTRGGGACCLEDCDIWFSDVVFDENTTSGSGAGVACFRSSPVLVGAVLLDNDADDYGGAIDLQTYCSPFLVNCTLVGNSAPEGGAVHATGASYPTVTQSIIAFTRAGSSTFFCDGTSGPTITYCMVFANAPGDSLCGDHYDNAFLDPLFCNVTTGNLALASNSPCLPGNPGNPTDVLVGALGQGCVSSAVRPTSWGRIKCLYR